MKRGLYFLYERLQITAAERITIYCLTGIVITLTALNPVISSSQDFDTEYYAPVFEVFEQRAQLADEQKNEILAQYFPEQKPGTNPVAEPLPTQVSETESITEEKAVTEVQTVSETDTETTISADDRININKASVDELVKLPGIGPAIAARIVEYRAENGPFEKIEDLKKVRGIGEARFENIRDLVKI